MGPIFFVVSVQLCLSSSGQSKRLSMSNWNLPFLRQKERYETQDILVRFRVVQFWE